MFQRDKMVWGTGRGRAVLASRERRGPRGSRSTVHGPRLRGTRRKKRRSATSAGDGVWGRSLCWGEEGEKGRRLGCCKGLGRECASVSWIRSTYQYLDES